ncbi:low-density lipoprotein receptor-related protein 1B isoform X2, partial [Silurus meridionalis]
MSWLIALFAALLCGKYRNEGFKSNYHNFRHAGQIYEVESLDYLQENVKRNTICGDGQSGATAVVSLNLGSLRDLIYLGPSTFPGELSLCNVNNGGCSDLCLLTPNSTVTCSCRGERTLLHDNRCVLTMFCSCVSNVLNSSCNTHSEFQCVSGECIDYELVCDGVSHCMDESDERTQYC